MNMGWHRCGDTAQGAGWLCVDRIVLCKISGHSPSMMHPRLLPGVCRQAPVSVSPVSGLKATRRLWWLYTPHSPGLHAYCMGAMLRPDNAATNEDHCAGLLYSTAQYSTVQYSVLMRIIVQVSWIQKSSLHVLTSSVITFTGTTQLTSEASPWPLTKLPNCRGQ